MRKTKMDGGITLIALIITIVVLLILAAVAINSITNDGILGKAENAVNRYNEAVKNEQNALDGYLEELERGEKIAVGSYVEYDISYTDMYQGTTYTSKSGWRYLGTDNDGNKLIISTAIPVLLWYTSSPNDSSEKWWGSGTYANEKAANGILNNLDQIPYTQKASGTSISTENTAIGRFAGTEGKIGDYFKSSTYEEKIIKVRTLTLAELNKSTNSATRGSRSETSTIPGFKDLKDEAKGLFDMLDLVGYTAPYYDYWLASHNAMYMNTVYCVDNESSNVSYDDNDKTRYTSCGGAII